MPTPNQQPPVGAGPSQTPPSSGASNNQIDPEVQTFTHAIALQEGGGKLLDYNAPGKSGETGRYQFTKPTWQNYAQQVIGDANAPMTPENQNKVAYTKFKQWKDKGYSYAQMASMWNAGEGAPDAWKGNKGVNSSGVNYDTAGYVKGVQKYAQQLSSNGISMGANQPAPDQGGDNPVVGAAKGVANFLFPIGGDIGAMVQGKPTGKSGLQIAADAGLSALPFIPGLGEVGEAARGTEAAAGIIPRLLGSKLAKGAAAGYGIGALNNVAQGQSIPEAIAPNLGTLGGAATGGLANSLLPKLLSPFTKNLTKKGAVSAVESNLADNLSRWQGLRTVTDSMPGKGKDAVSLIARTPGALPAVENGVFDTSAGRTILTKQRNALSELRGAALDKLGGIPPSLSGERAAELTTAVGEHNLPPSLQERAQKLIDEQYKDHPFEKAKGAELASQIAQLKENYGGDNISWSQLEKIKQQYPYSSPIARAARKMLEEGASQSGAPDLADINKIIQTHIHALQLLSPKGLHGKVVPGGRLGNMLRGHTMAVVGGAAANALGGGFLGTIGAALGAEGVNKLLSRMLGETSISNPVRDALLERIQAEDPGIVARYSQFTGGGGGVAPQRAPTQGSGAAGLIPRLLTQTAARVPSSMGQ